MPIAMAVAAARVGGTRYRRSAMELPRGSSSSIGAARNATNHAAHVHGNNAAAPPLRKERARAER